ncbi:hypothetical protein [Novosphingobium sp.]|uniref:hypothetical protein n=1 Tax=Novosphingobium sp. TaxID=1874826 RepID=UPI002B46D0B5|nr:hypothetical protein [Novosphingobium sp.]HKR92497.1 hypothetical protein [Novosphingobium sp.]
MIWTQDHKKISVTSYLPVGDATGWNDRLTLRAPDDALDANLKAKLTQPAGEWVLRVGAGVFSNARCSYSTNDDQIIASILQFVIFPLVLRRYASGKKE